MHYASKSLKASINTYIPFLNEPNLSNASEMSIAANLAGKAISISKTTAPHAISYPITTYCNIPHGHAVAISLGKFFVINSGLKSKYKKKS